MPLYQLATEILDSSLPFPELLPADGAATLRFEMGGQEAWPAESCNRIRSIELDDGRAWMTIGRLGSDFLFRFPEYCDFLYSPLPGAITCHPRPESGLETVRHLLLDHVLPLILNHRGWTVLHASAVSSCSGEALIFLGKSGAGKSTFAANLCKQGYSLVTDDCLALVAVAEQLRVVPLYPGLRLWENSAEQLQWDSAAFPTVAQYTHKLRVPIESAGIRYEPGPVSISAIYLFNPDGQDATEVELRHLGQSEAMIRLLESSYCLDPGNKQRNETDFGRLSRLAQTAPVIQVDFPYDFSYFHQLREAVLSAPVAR